MSPLLSLALGATVIVVGTLLVLVWHRLGVRRQRDGIAAFEREMRALAPDQPTPTPSPSTLSADGSERRPPGGMSPGP